MNRKLLLLGLLFAGATLLAQQAETPAPVQVMVIGSLHLANHNKDVVNVQVDDVLQPRHQRELERVAAELERFHPTKIAVEVVADPPDFVWKKELDPADLKTKHDELYQIAERLALSSHLDKLYGVDAAADLDFDAVQKMDEKVNAGKGLPVIFADVQKQVDAMQKLEHERGVAAVLADINRPEAIKEANAPYMQMLTIASGNDQPASRLNGEWYQRNVHIFSNLLQVAKPGDRIVLIFGQGHAYWLRSLVEQMPGYQFVDPEPYLKAAAHRH